MKIHTFRIRPGNDLKAAIEQYVRAHNIQAGFIVTCVAGLSQATLRMAGAVPDKQDIRIYDGDFEVTSLVGTVSVNGVHLHMSIADNEGISLGGHLKEGSIVHPTAEVVVGEDESAIFTRELDEETGFPELTVK
jgi:hypothetical protein